MCTQQQTTRGQGDTPFSLFLVAFCCRFLLLRLAGSSPRPEAPSLVVTSYGKVYVSVHGIYTENLVDDMQGIAKEA